MWVRNIGAVVNKRGFTLVEVMAVVLLISLVIAIAIPNFVANRRKAQATVCIANLRRIEEGKAVWVADGAVGAENSMDTLVTSYIKSTPRCPGGGTYEVGNRNEVPTCTVQGHALYRAD